MPALVAGIRAFNALKKVVDGRDKLDKFGHDAVGVSQEM